jgi:hypothetical protein
MLAGGGGGGFENGEDLGAFLQARASGAASDAQASKISSPAEGDGSPRPCAHRMVWTVTGRMLSALRPVGQALRPASRPEP